MKKWKIEIVKVHNGYQAKFSGGDSNEEKVYEDKTEDPQDLDREHIVDMFYDIIGHFGETGSKYDKKRLRVEYKKNE